MRDVQNSHDNRKIPIKKVGVKDLRYPIEVLDKNNEYQSTIANISMYVDLPHHFKGTHMSRFVEILNEYRGEVTLRNINQLLGKMTDQLNSDCAHVEIDFAYFISKIAPVSKRKSLLDYNCSFIASYSKQDQQYNNILQVKTPVTTLCPCSKEISKYGAHNQRAIVTIQVKYSDFVWIEELIEIAESSASSPLYTLLKREDEKYVTEKAYDKPVFVEDLVRNAAVLLNQDPRILWYRVESENFESIHNHSAYAMVESG
ncbi:GTP cyclohydrolase FolE2 [Candidatus Uabimicrobium amorphum]|uniref:GTP cyclohydrolase FolE2 n=1 Tax=Uabimicrobium amorphum TaxID=2596890 RepID=A0A5S9IT30_UABAM|nr:GTP cyclohydrolase FolE2 [Candidatus Uabimicrobium amorphum]BBM87116.1 GTP cyclohydrolase FolE2 [Candidatus Uabimicrobium amorphum]